jgi:hypothetical protein
MARSSWQNLDDPAALPQPGLDNRLLWGGGRAEQAFIERRFYRNKGTVKKR